MSRTVKFNVKNMPATSVPLVCLIQTLIIFSLAKAGDKCLATVTLMMASRR